MGYSDAEVIRDAADYLLGVLLDSQELAYSTFYDGTDNTHDELMKSIGLEDEWYSAERLIDLAVVQLEEQGIVRTEKLASKLADDENDYLIELTDAGRKRIDAGFQPSFRDME